MPPLVVRRVGQQLVDLRRERGRRLNDADFEPFVELTGRSVRQLQRYANQIEREQGLRTLLDGQDKPASVLLAARRAAAGQRAQYEIDEHALRVLAVAPNRYETWQLLRYLDKDSTEYQRELCKTTFYEAFERLPRSVQVGLLKGSEAMSNLEPHLLHQTSEVAERTVHGSSG
jgi:hypothetical protein